jgi:hypothetical protein
MRGKIRHIGRDVIDAVVRRARKYDDPELSRMSVPRGTLKQDAWKSYLGNYLGNRRWNSGTHIKGETYRRRSLQRRQRKVRLHEDAELAMND